MAMRKIRMTNPRTVQPIATNEVEIITAEQAKIRANAIGLPASQLSYSQINTFMLCQKSYEFQYVQRLPRESWSDNLVLGSAIHAGFEVLNTAKMHGRKCDRTLLQQAQSTCANSVNQAIVTMGNVSPANKKRLAIQIERCGEILETWFTEFFPTVTPTGVEEKLYVLIHGIPMVVIIDLVDGNIVKDYKLSRRAKSEYTANDSLQLSLYSLVKNARQAGFISCPFPDLKKRKYDPRPKEVIVEKSKYDKEWASEIVSSISKSIILATREKHFTLCDPESWKCSEKFCDWWSICRGRHQPKPGQFMSVHK